jgi:superfamily I DNA and/or RNA helicase/very-short-patch-repair endonuclease
VDKLRELDSKIFKNQNKQLIENLTSIEITEGVSRGLASELSEKSLIKREIDKKRAHIPFRQLMKRAGKALREYKPCYMLSPISLSQIVNPEPEIFDVLIVDEASQMKIEDAIGSILRAKQVIIVGDPMQLPPTNFFNASAEFNTDDGVVDDDESILDLALSKFSSRMLRWHYRSKHESLINFSNYHFYQNNLIIPPSANDKFAIKNNYLKKAIYSASTLKKKNAKESIGERGGVNIIEANEIADGVIAFMRESIKKNIKRSCLVVTMNNSQRDLIDEEIRHKATKIPEANTYIGMWDETMEPFTVKNLENVQGDERDYIFVSTLFGPNKEGITMQRFGPINHPKGHRRLNVLFTRAKQGLELYTSLTPNVIRDGGEKGRSIFKSYLDYAATQKIETGVSTERSTDSDFEDWVKEELEKLGYEVIPQVGVSGFFIDLGIKHKNFKYGYLAGVECDGAAYHSSVSARDNDVTRQRVLESMGWNIYRIWSTNWFDNPKNEIKKLDNYLKVLLKDK